MKLYYHPLSTYSQKVLAACYEKEVSFEPHLVDLMDPKKAEEYRKLNPLGKVPMLIRDDGWKIPESSIIVEYIDTHFDKGPKLIPEDKELGRQVRFFDRITDLYLNESVGGKFWQGQKPEAEKNKELIDRYDSRIKVMYPMLEEILGKNTWFVGNDFSMADCSLGPVLNYAKKSIDAHPRRNRKRKLRIKPH